MPFYFNNNNNNKAQKKKPKAVKLEWNHDAVFLSLTPFFHLSSQVVKFLTRQLVCSVDTLVWRAPRVPLVWVLLLRHKKRGEDQEERARWAEEMERAGEDERAAAGEEKGDRECWEGGGRRVAGEDISHCCAHHPIPLTYFTLPSAVWARDERRLMNNRREGEMDANEAASLPLVLSPSFFTPPVPFSLLTLFLF